MSFFGWGDDKKKKINPKEAYHKSKGFDPRRCPGCKEFPKPENVKYSFAGKGEAYCEDCDIYWAY